MVVASSLRDLGLNHYFYSGFPDEGSSASEDSSHGLWLVDGLAATHNLEAHGT